jgi:hypothetical protein
MSIYMLVLGVASLLKPITLGVTKLVKLPLVVIASSITPVPGVGSV